MGSALRGDSIEDSMVGLYGTGVPFLWLCSFGGTLLDLGYLGLFGISGLLVFLCTFFIFISLV